MTARIKKTAEHLLSNEIYTFSRHEFIYRRSNGESQTLSRVVLERGHGAAALLYDPLRATVILVGQYRYPAWAAGYSGPMLEVCAGLLDGDDPLTCIRREIEEETGYRVNAIEQVCTTFLSPGVMTEQVHLFTARYSPADKISAGGGLIREGEDIEVIEMPFADAFAMIAAAQIVDAKSILLLQHAKLTGLLESNEPTDNGV